MLAFMRIHAMKIVFAVLLFFGVTMFSGVFLFQDFSNVKTNRDTKQDKSHAVASLGDIYIKPDTYLQKIELAIQSYRRINPKMLMDPEILELLQIRVVESVISEELFYREAKKQASTVNNLEYKVFLQKVLNQEKLESKQELKTVLKENGRSYKQFKENLNRYIIIQKFLGSIQSSIKISEQDVLNQFRDIFVSQIVLKPDIQDGYSNNEILQAQAATLDKATQLRQKILDGGSFASIAKKTSIDLKSKDRGGDLGWVIRGDLNPILESAAFSLSKGELSQPINTPDGYFLLYVKDDVFRPIPEGLDLEEERKRIQVQEQQKQLGIIQESIRPSGNVIAYEPSLSAAYAKVRGDWELAEGSYYKLASRDPSNPIPYYLLGRLYMRKKDFKSVESVFEKAEVLIELKKGFVFPLLYMAWAELYKEKKLNSLAKIMYQKSVRTSRENESALLYLKQQFSYLNEPAFLKEVENLLKNILPNMEATEN